MKSVVLDSPGSPDKLHIEEVAIPTPKEGEILVKVHAVGLNPVDYKMASSGHPSWEYPFILGLDVAGTVETVGPEVDLFTVGDKVLYHGDLSKPGGYAEYAVTTAHTAAKIPNELSFTDAAALPCAGLTAYQGLFRKINMSNMNSILIHGGAGGVGGFAVQLAKLNDLKVITTCSPRNNEWVKSLGADFIIDYTSEDVHAKVMDITNQRGVDIIFNTLGGDSVLKDIDNLAFNGHLICIVALPDMTKVNTWEKAISIHTIALGGAHSSGDLHSQKDLRTMAEELSKLVAQNKINPMTAHVISLEEVPEYLWKLAERHIRGKIVAKIC